MGPTGASPSPPQPRLERLEDLIVVQKEEEEKAPKKVEQVSSVQQQSSSVTEEIPAGSFVRGILLSGLDAPVGGNAQSNPMPVLIRVVSRSIMPNFWKANIRNCFVVGSGYGDLSSERVYIRLNLLSCVTNDGRILERHVKGYVAGRDGKVGILGRVVSKQGQLIGRAIIAGFVQGIGQILNYSQSTVLTSPLGVTTTISPSQVAKAGAFGGMAQAAEQLAQYYMKLVNMTMPVIEVNAGQKVDMVFLAPVKFKGGSPTETAATNPKSQPVSYNDLIRTIK